jgi:integrase
MSEDHSTPSTARGKPAKPYPEFPLTAHPAGYWCKKIRGKIHYFGPWGDPDGALKNYEAQAEALHAGRKPREAAGETTVKELVNHFLAAKDAKVDAGELSPLTWACYKTACDCVVRQFGKGRLVADLDADDFAALRKKMAGRWGPATLGTKIACVRCAFRHAFEAGLIDRPIRFGPEFKQPSKKTLRLHRAAAGPNLFSVEEVRRILDAADVQLKAMALLGVNCGLGNSDCGRLPLSAVDLEAAVIDFPRPKTGIARRCPLWPETVQAIRDALAGRVAPRQEKHAGLVFLTSYGLPWAKGKTDQALARKFGDLLRKLGINGRKRRGFYTLRHVFRTVADEAKDQPAADYIMGHEAPHMSSHYREKISDARLRAVADYVRAWLYPPAQKGRKAKAAGAQ